MSRKQEKYQLTIDDLARSFILSWLKAKKGAMTLSEIHAWANHFYKIHLGFMIASRKYSIVDVFSYDLGDSIKEQRSLRGRKVAACDPDNIDKALSKLVTARKVHQVYNNYWYADFSPKIRTIDDDWQV